MSGLLKTVALCLLAGGSTASTQELRLDASRLCVTEGAIGLRSGDKMSIAVSKMRAVASVPTAHSIELRFIYRGTSAETSSLGSGQIREQLGLKLRAANGCNVVYAMWRIAPRNELVVSIKNNPGLSQSAECGNGGYRNIKPRIAQTPPLLRAGQAHTLRAELHGREMRVSIDGRLNWLGNLAPDGLTFDGPVGIRTDNVALDFELFAGAPQPGDTTALPACADS